MQLEHSGGLALVYIKLKKKKKKETTKLSEN